MALLLSEPACPWSWGRHGQACLPEATLAPLLTGFVSLISRQTGKIVPVVLPLMWFEEVRPPRCPCTGLPWAWPPVPQRGAHGGIRGWVGEAAHATWNNPGETFRSATMLSTTPLSRKDHLGGQRRPGGQFFDGSVTTSPETREVDFQGVSFSCEISFPASQGYFCILNGGGGAGPGSPPMSSARQSGVGWWEAGLCSTEPLGVGLAPSIPGGLLSRPSEPTPVWWVGKAVERILGAGFYQPGVEVVASLCLRPIGQNEITWPCQLQGSLGNVDSWCGPGGNGDHPQAWGVGGRSAGATVCGPS